MTPGTFLDPAALAIVFGGATLATVLRTPARDLARAVAALTVLPRRRFRAETLLDQIATLSRIARRHGVVALDRTVIADRDVAQAIALVVDAAPPAEIARTLEEARRARIERHRTVADVWAGLAEALPAMGMVGTLVGLVAMFTRMADPRAIGAAMAVALLATLYGALASHLLAMPIASRLRRAARVEALERLRLVAPLVALAEREAPRTTALRPAFDSYEDMEDGGDDSADAPEAEAA
ncbi:motility protein A [Sphingomonas adhaesiva]|uniref:motility protein A n=1 Tax=Sphingomonas adhaesiva TaxID=28212 RepID=UPI002FFB5370